MFSDYYFFNSVLVYLNCVLVIVLSFLLLLQFLILLMMPRGKCIKQSINKEGRRQWHPTPVLLPRKSHGRRSLVGCSPWGREELDTASLSLSLFTFMHWGRKWQPTPVFLPGESKGRGSLVGCRLWGHTESDTTEAT